MAEKVILDTGTGEMTPIPEARHIEQHIVAEAVRAHRWIPRTDAISDGAKRMLWGSGIVALVGLSALAGGFTRDLTERQTTAAAIARSMQTAIPVVAGLAVDVDPGKFEGKLTDVVMTITKGGVFKSGKGLYLQEHDGGMSLVIFESAFEAFLGPEGGKPSDIVARLIGKTVKARGTIRAFGQEKDGNRRLSMVLYAPGLLSELPSQ